MTSNDVTSTRAVVEEECNTDDIVDKMTVQDLRDFAKHILRLAKDSKDDRILSEVNFLIHRQQRRRLEIGNGDGIQVMASHSVDLGTSMSTITLDPSHPDSILSLPPLVRNSRSHDSDVADAPQRFSRKQQIESPTSPTVRTSNTTPSSRVTEERALPTQTIQNVSSDGDGNKDRSSEIPGFGKRQLVVLCNRKPATAKECKDQDLAMTLCKNMGIIPCVIVSALSSENTTATKEEQLLVDSMSVKASGERVDEPGNTAPAYSYPQFFVRNILKDQNKNESVATIYYKGNYDTIENLYRTGMFSADSLEAIPVTSARGAANGTTPWNDNNKDTLASFIRETSKPIVSRAGKGRGDASLGEPSLPSPRHKLLEKPTSELPKMSLQPRLDEQFSSEPRSRSQSPPPFDFNGSSSTTHSACNSSSAHNSSKHSAGSSSYNLNMSNSDSVLLLSQNGDVSYSHLDGMNQPNSIQNSTSSGFCGDNSLGDDIRMIFDIEDEVVPMVSAVVEANATAEQTPVNIADVPTITEDEEEDDEVADETQARRSVGLAAVPTITEDEEEDDEVANEISPRRSVGLAAVPAITEDEEEEEDDDDDDEDEGNYDKPEDRQINSVSMTVLPSGTILKRETVTLKPSKERSQTEPLGIMAPTGDSSYLDHAKDLLKSPPSSPKKLRTAFKPVDPSPKKIPNPYYALDCYSGRGNSGDSSPVSGTILPPGESSPPTISGPIAVVEDTTGDEREPTWIPAQEKDIVLDLECLPWGKKFIGIGACYLVFNSGNDELNIHYSESPMANAVGVWTSPDIGNFKETQGLSECELIGTCAINVTQDGKCYCQGWCQFIKAAKIMDATVTALVDMGLPVDFYLYDKGRTILISSCDGEALFDTKTADAIACVPKGCDFQASGIVGKKWGKIAKKLGAVALFKSLSVKKSKNFDDESQLSTGSKNSNTVNESPVPASVTHDESESSFNYDMLSPLESTRISLSSTIVPKTAPLPEPPTKLEAVTPLSTELTCPDSGACYLIYDPDSSGQLVEHYSKIRLDFAIGRWIPGPEKKIAGFKFKRNLGRNALIGNCSGGVQGRKNFYSGWCQFVRSAKNMKGEVILWDPAVGHKGLKVDVFLYYDDHRPFHETVRMEEGTAYTTDNILAVACVPKDTPFYENMTVDLLKWLADGSNSGYSSKM